MKNIIYLDGLWSMCLDPDGKGIEKMYYSEDSRDEFEDTIMLPSTLGKARKGNKNSVREPDVLTANYKYEGKAWFQRKVIINEIEEKNVKLFLERTRKTMVWVNGQQAGGIQENLFTPHIYDVGEYLVTGENTITIMTDNTDCTDTMANWNGITGEISLRFYDGFYVENIRIFSDIEKKKVNVRLKLVGIEKTEISAYVYIGDNYFREQQFEIFADKDGFAEFTYAVNDDIRLWSEHTPEVYNMIIELPNGEKECIKFGMREFSECGTGLKLNGKPIFLRGKNDRLVFPLTGIAPTNVECWRKILKTAKEYGVNYYCFDECCPPESAFVMADKLGIYFAPFFSDKDLFSDIVETFGNHPSFCMIPVKNKKISANKFYPDFNEIEKYTGVLKARNFEIFRECLEECGMLGRWEKYFKASGMLAAARYKDEIESEMLSQEVSGIQIDLQDFSGKETAISGVLNAFMENKGFISNYNWRGFFSDKILLAEFDSYILTGEKFTADVSIRCHKLDGFSDDYIRWEISRDNKIIVGGEIDVCDKGYGLVRAGIIEWNVPKYVSPVKLTLTLVAKCVENSYDFWVFPNIEKTVSDIITDNVETALEMVRNGKKALLITDKVKCKVDDGDTMGLVIDNMHESLSQFPSEFYQTPQWQSIVDSGVCVILDDVPKKYFPIVQMVDNVERNHRLGNVFEANILGGKLMVCAMSLEKLLESSEGRWFVKSVCDYCEGNSFNPKFTLDEEYVKSLF